MKRSTLERLGIVLIIAIGVIHLSYAQDEFEEVQYLGILFVLNFVGALVTAAGIWRRQSWGWLLGLFVAAGSVTGYVLSRTIAMPGHEVEAWLVPIGVISLALESIFVILVFAVWPHLSSSNPGALATVQAGRVRRLTPIVTLLGVVLLGCLTSYRMTRSESITQDRLDAELGLRVTMVSTTLMGGVIDVRMRVSDTEKADAIFNEHEKMPHVQVENRDIVLLPPSHGHKKTLLPGRTYSMLFPNVAGAIQPGSAVSLVFGNRTLEPLTVQ